MPSDPPPPKTLEMRVADLEDKLSKLHASIQQAQQTAMVCACGMAIHTAPVCACAMVCACVAHPAAYGIVAHPMGMAPVCACVMGVPSVASIAPVCACAQVCACVYSMVCACAHTTAPASQTSDTSGAQTPPTSQDFGKLGS